MFRWFVNRFRKKERSRRLKIHQPTIVKVDDFPSTFTPHESTSNRRDNPLNHIYEEIDGTTALNKPVKKTGKKVHFLETKCHSVSDISQVAREEDFAATSRRSSSLVNFADQIDDKPVSFEASNELRIHPVKPPRKTRPGTRRWHTMLEKPDKRPLITRQRDSYDREKTGRFRVLVSKYGESRCMEPGDSDSGYENSNCSSNDSDVIELSPLTGYEYYLSKIEQLRLLEEEVDGLVNDLDIADISEAHTLVNARLNSPQMVRHFRALEGVRHQYDTRRTKYSIMPDPTECTYCACLKNQSSNSCESLSGHWTPYENTTGLQSRAFIDQKLGVFSGQCGRNRPCYEENHRNPVPMDRCNISDRREAMGLLSHKWAWERKHPSGASVSRHHTIGAVDASKSLLCNKPLRDLIRNNHHKQHIAAKM